jgi:hypothetical protein
MAGETLAGEMLAGDVNLIILNKDLTNAQL